MIANVTLTQLRYFSEVAKTGSFGKAAKRCFVTQPTLSMQIQKLEENLGGILLDRGKKPIRPTPIGTRLLERANQILQLADSLSDVVEEEQAEVGGEFHLGVIPTLAPYLLPKFLPTFLKRYPKIRLVAEECETQMLIDRLRVGTLDAGLAATPLEARGIEEVPLFQESFSAYLAKEHPLLKKKTLESRDIVPSELLLLKEGHCFRTQVLNFCRTRPSPRSAALTFESGNLETLRRLVDGRFGATLLPQLAIDALTPGQRSQVRRFRAPSPVRQISLVHSGSYLRHRLIDALADTIRERVPQEFVHKTRVIPVGSFD